LLTLLQLASPALPVGAFSYSEGLEALTGQGHLQTAADLEHWLVQELRYGAVRLEGAIATRAHRALHQPEQLYYWNQWLSAARETEELRHQSWQMGRALVRLLQVLYPDLNLALSEAGVPCNFAVAFGIGAARGQVSEAAMVLGYLHSWASNLVNAAVKLVPLGQTEGQSVLVALIPEITTAATQIGQLPDEQLTNSGWGLTIASMQHETLYTRLFRS
jgi:urease accessory protein